MIRFFLRRWALAAVPVLTAAGLLGGPGSALCALTGWMGLGWRLGRRVPALYPRQRRPRARRLIPALAAGWAALIIPWAVPVQAGLPAWLGAAFFASVLCAKIISGR